jgi:hypothetical protein
MLERYAQTKLHRARPGLFSLLDVRRHPVTGGAGNICRANVGIQVIKKVGELRVELQAHTLRQMKLFAKRRGKSGCARSLQDAHAAVAETSDVVSWDGICVDVRQRRRSGAIRPLRGSYAAHQHAGTGWIGSAVRRRQIRARLCQKDSRDRPVAEHRVGEPAGVTEIRLAMMASTARA